MQLQLEEGGFRAAGKCGCLEPQEPVMSVRHSDGLAPHNRDVTLVHAVNTEMQLHSHCLSCLRIPVLVLKLYFAFSVHSAAHREGVKHVCLLMVLHNRCKPLVLHTC